MVISNFFHLSTAGAQFICNFESFRAKPYKDGGGVWTIGYGTVIDKASLGKYANGITVEQATSMMMDYAVAMCHQLSKCPLGGLFQYQYDAIASLVYNIGFDAFQNSTIYKNLTLRNYDLSSWIWFVKDNKGNVEEGLLRRRKLELQLFIYGQYNTKTTRPNI